MRLRCAVLDDFQNVDLTGPGTPREGVDGIFHHEAGTFDDLLKLAGGLSGLVRGEVRQATHVCGIEAAEAREERRRRQGIFVRAAGGLERGELFGKPALLHGNKATKSGEVADVHRRVLRIARFEILRRGLGSRPFTGERQREGGGECERASHGLLPPRVLAP